MKWSVLSAYTFSSATMIYVIGIITSLILTFIVIELATKYYLSRQPDAPEPGLEEFPEIQQSDLSKFSSFDPELGWERQPNQERKTDVGGPNPDDPDADTVVFSTDSYGSRICDISRNNSNFTVTTYGDSYCACRGVGDDESFQHYMSQNLGVHVGNYGVGNYGLDQALLRIKKRFDQDPAEYVILASSDSVTVDRLLSAWKHYFEFGNTFAVKPRYKFVGGELKLIRTPISDKSDLLNLEDYKYHLRGNDYHYEHWFIPHIIDFPYAKYWFQNQNNFPYALFSVLAYMSPNYSKTYDIFDSSREKWAPKDDLMRRRDYRRHLESKHTNLLCSVLSEFTDYVRSQDAVPIYFPISQISPNKYKKPINNSVIRRINQECPELHVLDVRDQIAKRVDGN
jgi:hypothetical protein